MQNFSSTELQHYRKIEIMKIQTLLKLEKDVTKFHTMAHYETMRLCMLPNMCIHYFFFSTRTTHTTHASHMLWSLVFSCCLHSSFKVIIAVVISIFCCCALHVDSVMCLWLCLQESWLTLFLLLLLGIHLFH